MSRGQLRNAQFTKCSNIIDVISWVVTTIPLRRTRRCDDTG